jgi:Ca2+-binding EF-hand superfamily protein
MIRLLLLAAAALPLVAQEQPPGTTPMPVDTSRREFAKQFFDRMDANKDGSVEVAEVKQYYGTAMGGQQSEASNQLFARLDADNDGKLTSEEFAVLGRFISTRPPGPPPPKAEEMLKRWDANGDGKVTLEEFEASRQQTHRPALPGQPPMPLTPMAPPQPEK